MEIPHIVAEVDADPRPRVPRPSLSPAAASSCTAHAREWRGDRRIEAGRVMRIAARLDRGADGVAVSGEYGVI